MNQKERRSVLAMKAALIATVIGVLSLGAILLFFYPEGETLRLFEPDAGTSVTGLLQRAGGTVFQKTHQDAQADLSSVSTVIRQLRSVDKGEEDNSDLTTGVVSEKRKDKTFPVYITGSVNKPGIYHIRQTMHLYELVDLAGGFSSEAMTDAVNLAAVLEPESHISIPSRQEWERMGEFGRNAWLKTQPTAANSVLKKAAADDALLVDINRADKTALLDVPGIGEVTAQRILQYRETHGPFKHIDDLQNIEGIKAAKVKKIARYLSCS